MHLPPSQVQNEIVVTSKQGSVSKDDILKHSTN